ncbi:hypothetical protein F4604DRAFT_1687335 [Suillus subluteus]|nr:hypothetical protein F4604DRAFT_1687335 [Suillus subluteus]
MLSRRVHFSTPLETQGVQNLPSAVWWGNFVPIDQWTPPRDITWVQKLGLRRSKIWEIQLPTGMIGPALAWTIILQNFLSVDEEEEVDELMDDDSPSYDLGWSAASSAPGDAPTPDDRSFADDREDQGPVYDLGWGHMAPDAPTLDDNAITGEHGDQGPTYDLGWGPTMPKALSDAASVGPEDDTPVYDLRWGEISSVEDSMDEDSPAYDLG